MQLLKGEIKFVKIGSKMLLQDVKVEIKGLIQDVKGEIKGYCRM